MSVQACVHVCACVYIAAKMASLNSGVFMTQLRQNVSDFLRLPRNDRLTPANSRPNDLVPDIYDSGACRPRYLRSGDLW